MFKKILISFVVLFDIWGAYGAYSIYGSSGKNVYCASESNKCAWCLGGGTTHISNCIPQYAGCTGGVTDVSVGATHSNLRCNSTGFCYTSCGTRTRTEGNVTITEQGSGCMCDTWTVISVTASCQYGYYYSADAGYCVQCPSVMCEGCGDNAWVDENDQQWSYGHTPSMANMTITDCYLRTSRCIREDNCRNEYKDETGVYVITSEIVGKRCNWVE